MKREDYISKFKDVNIRCEEIFDKIDIESLEKKQIELELISAKSDFWDNTDRAKETLKKISDLKNDIFESNQLLNLFSEIQDYYELVLLGEDLSSESISSLDNFVELLDKFEIKAMLNGENDHLGAILSIHPGAGGTESEDWVNMLFRMYCRWFDKNDYKYKIVDYQEGDEGGVKEVTIEIDANYIYGFLTSESGVHRLVRISPFDSNSRRHTSFAAVFVFPIIDDNI